MEINHQIVKKLCKKRGLAIGALLRAAGVSNNAYYSLVQKESILPRSIVSLAQALEVPVSDLLFDRQALLREHAELMCEVEEVLEAIGGGDRDLVKHTLLLLKEKPIVRLRRGLELGRVRSA